MKLFHFILCTMMLFAMSAYAALEDQPVRIRKIEKMVSERAAKMSGEKRAIFLDKDNNRTEVPLSEAKDYISKHPDTYVGYDMGDGTRKAVYLPSLGKYKKLYPNMRPDLIDPGAETAQSKPEIYELYEYDSETNLTGLEEEVSNKSQKDEKALAYIILILMSSMAAFGVWTGFVTTPKGKPVKQERSSETESPKKSKFNPVLNTILWIILIWNIVGLAGKALLRLMSDEPWGLLIFALELVGCYGIYNTIQAKKKGIYILLCYYSFQILTYLAIPWIIDDPFSAIFSVFARMGILSALLCIRKDGVSAWRAIFPKKNTVAVNTNLSLQCKFENIKTTNKNTKIDFNSIDFNRISDPSLLFCILRDEFGEEDAVNIIFTEINEVDKDIARQKELFDSSKGINEKVIYQSRINSLKLRKNLYNSALSLANKKILKRRKNKKQMKIAYIIILSLLAFLIIGLISS